MYQKRGFLNISRLTCKENAIFLSRFFDVDTIDEYLGYVDEIEKR